jgi:hypothetical protein
MRKRLEASGSFEQRPQSFREKMVARQEGPGILSRLRTAVPQAYREFPGSQLSKIRDVVSGGVSEISERYREFPGKVHSLFIGDPASAPEALEQRGQARLGELGTSVRRLVPHQVPVIGGPEVANQGVVGRVVSDPRLDLLQGLGEISGASVGDLLSNPFGERRSFTESLGRHLERPPGWRIPMEIISDPLAAIGSAAAMRKFVPGIAKQAGRGIPEGAILDVDTPFPQYKPRGSEQRRERRVLEREMRKRDPRTSEYDPFVGRESGFHTRWPRSATKKRATESTQWDPAGRTFRRETSFVGQEPSGWQSRRPTDWSEAMLEEMDLIERGRYTTGRKARAGRHPRVTSNDIDPSIVIPSANSANLFGLHAIEVGLGRLARFSNVFKSSVRRLGGKDDVEPLLHHEYVDGLKRERRRVLGIISAQSTRIGTMVDEVLRQGGVRWNAEGRIIGTNYPNQRDLTGIDPSIIGTPTIADVAARLPLYAEALGPNRLRAFEQLRELLAPLKQARDEVGIKTSIRPDVMDQPLPVTIPLAESPRGLSGLLQTRLRQGQPEVFHHGIGVRGGFYVPRVLRTQITEGGPQYRRRIPGYEEVARYPSQSMGIDEGDVYLPIDEAIRRYVSDVGENVLDAHSVRYLRPLAYETGTKRSVSRLEAFARRDRPGIGREPPKPKGKAINRLLLPGLEGSTFDSIMQRAIERELTEEMGTNWGPMALAIIFNKLYLGFRSTWDNSSLMIQGLLGLANNPLVLGHKNPWHQALRVNIRAWWREGDRALGQYFLAHDDLARKHGMPTVQDWNSAGLHVGGSRTEFALGQGPTEALGRLPLIRQANRAFGSFGDTIRIAWADAEVEGMIRKGVSGPELREAMENIARAVNGGTGYAQGKTFADFGDFLFLAPRFLQSRLETVGRAAMSLQDVVPGRSSTLDERIARRALFRLAGVGTALTFAANEALGQETDTRPFIKIKRGTRRLSTPTRDPISGRMRTTEDLYERVPNSNFMRVRYAGRDWSMFGTWDSILRVMMATASGDPVGAGRPLMSGSMSVATDLLSGRDFQGKPVLRSGQAIKNDPGRFAEWVGEQVYPFAAEEMPSAVGRVASGEFAEGMTTIVGEVVGAKSSPLSLRERRDVLAQSILGRDYDDLHSLYKKMIQSMNNE